VCLFKDKPDSGSEACVTALGNGTEEDNIKVENAGLKIEEFDMKIEEAEIRVEESEDIKEENAEAITIPSIKPKPEVILWGLFIRMQCFMLPRAFTATEREILKIHFNYFYVCALHFVQYIIQKKHCTTCSILTINFNIINLQVL
jgi:hypothetical protein